MNRAGYEAIATLVGVVIGAGILGIPYVVAKAGFLVGAINIIVIGILVLFMNLFMGEIVLRTKGNHQLSGYAEKYLGKTGKLLMTIAFMIGTYGALLAYLIGEGEALSAIFGGNPLYYSLGFFIVVSAIVYIGLKAVEQSELYFGIIFLTIIIIIMGFNIAHINPDNFLITNGNIFLPFGVVLFAFLGLAAIPEMHEELKNNWKHMKKAIIIGSLIPLVVYLTFGLSVTAVTGAETSKVATIGLGESIGEYMIIFGNLFAVFAMATSFIALGLALKEMYDYDFKIGHKTSFLLTVSLPLILFLIGFKDFIGTISVAGSFSGGITGILVVLMLWNARKKSEREPEFKVSFIYFLGIIIIIMFLLGIAYQIMQMAGLF
ncbi:amino acid permease [Candidatus Woesearchaeota archaeon]|nr:amino acid permease [Candidatus Woesearchaeota archaeon]